MDITRLLCYPLHTGILGCPTIDPVSDTGHQFSATHAIINFLPALKDITVFFLLQTFPKLTAHQNSITTNSYLGFQFTLKTSWFFFFLTLGLLYLFIYLWLCWIFISVRGLSLVVASGGHSSSRCSGLSLSRSLLLQSTGSNCAGSVIVAHGPSCSAACGIFPDQGSNPCPLHWQADSQPLRHQGSPPAGFIFNSFVAPAFQFSSSR